MCCIPYARADAIALSQQCPDILREILPLHLLRARQCGVRILHFEKDGLSIHLKAHHARSSVAWNNGDGTSHPERPIEHLATKPPSYAKGEIAVSMRNGDGNQAIRAEANLLGRR